MLAGKLMLLYCDKEVMKNEQALAFEQYHNVFQWSVKEHLVNAVYDAAQETGFSERVLTIKSSTSL
jgi:hypothetical protein